jgi:peptidoglycan/xylan/chitin deacetylase (PgdA/CDA1 family)
MKMRKPWLILLTAGLICLLCTNLYILFLRFHVKGEVHPPSAMEAKQDEYVKSIISDKNNPETEYNEQNSDELTEIEAGQLPDSNVFVREVPLQLESEMQDHLEQFRRKARLLYQEFPESFLISMESSEKTIALTFDDGPDASSTLEVVNILNEYGIPGTFFLIGEQIERYPDTVKAIAYGGHSLGNHSWSHIRPTDISPEAVMDEVDKAEQQLASYGAAAKLYRPPYGLVNRSQMPMLIEAGYRIVSWSVDSMDWYFEKPEQIVSCVIENAHPGAIVLMHSSGGRNNRRAAIEALPIIIETLLDEGYRFVGLGSN